MQDFTSLPDVKGSILSCLHTADTGVSRDAPGYVQIQFTTCACCHTEHEILSFNAQCVTELCFWSFFCISKVIVMLSADLSYGEGKGMRQLFCSMLFHLRNLWYSHEQQAKKEAPIDNCEIAFSVSVNCLFVTSARMKMGKALVVSLLSCHFGRIYIAAIERC